MDLNHPQCSLLFRPVTMLLIQIVTIVLVGFTSPLLRRPPGYAPSLGWVHLVRHQNMSYVHTTRFLGVTGRGTQRGLSAPIH